MIKTTKLDIINKALLRIGLPVAPTLSDASWNAREQWQSCAIEVLRTFNWGWATNYAVLESASTGEAVPFGWQKTYVLPTDYVKVIDIHSDMTLKAPKFSFQIISGRRLVTEADPAYCRYIIDVTGLESDNNTLVMPWPADFIDAVATQLAIKILPLEAQTQAMTAYMLQVYNLTLEQAQAADSAETNERVPLDEDIYMARTGVRQQ